MKQPPPGQPPEYGPQPPKGRQPQYGQPQFTHPQHGQQPTFRQPPYGPPPFEPAYAPAYESGQYPQYPPPVPPKRSNRNVILAIIGVFAIAGGVVAAVLLTGGDDDKKQSAGPGGKGPVSENPVPGKPSSFRSTGRPSQALSVAALSCTDIEDEMIGSGAFKDGTIAVSDGGTPPGTGAPRPAGAPTTTCTVRPTDPKVAEDFDHMTAIAWHGATEQAFAAQLKSAGYDVATSEGDYTIYLSPGGSEPDVVTATIADELVTFYLA